MLYVHLGARVELVEMFFKGPILLSPALPDLRLQVCELLPLT